jgi:hypothetical protein
MNNVVLTSEPHREAATAESSEVRENVTFINSSPWPKAMAQYFGPILAEFHRPRDDLDLTELTSQDEVAHHPSTALSAVSDE